MEGRGIQPIEHSPCTEATDFMRWEIPVCDEKYIIIIIIIFKRGQVMVENNNHNNQSIIVFCLTALILNNNNKNLPTVLLFELCEGGTLMLRSLSLLLQMQRPAEESGRQTSALHYLLLRSGRIILWWCTAEYMIHVMYMHCIQSNETYLEILPPWALGEYLHGTYF